jgi:hypothetical protein
MINIATMGFKPRRNFCQLDLFRDKFYILDTRPELQRPP